VEKLRKELDPERSELFFASRLLLVEGDTEKLALPAYAARLAIDLDRAGATIVEAGGKTNLMDLAAVATSFGIPTGILFDQDSGEFKDKRAEEARLNADLESLATADQLVRVWSIAGDYEKELRRTLGNAEYERLCSSIPSVSKPIRARLIAETDGTPIPGVVEEVLSWLGGPAGAGVAEAPTL
jgi:predicted ATP-dependent endonuclease of OLD family